MLDRGKLGVKVRHQRDRLTKGQLLVIIARFFVSVVLRAKERQPHDRRRDFDWQDFAIRRQFADDRLVAHRPRIERRHQHVGEPTAASRSRARSAVKRSVPCHRCPICIRTARASMRYPSSPGQPARPPLRFPVLRCPSITVWCFEKALPGTLLCLRPHSQTTTKSPTAPLRFTVRLQAHFVRCAWVGWQPPIKRGSWPGWRRRR